MASFAYTAVDTDGREKQGSIEAVSEAAARAVLASRNLLPVRVLHAAVADKTQRAKRRNIPDRARLRHRDLVLVTRQLATLIDASVTVDDALGTLAAQEERAATRRIVSDLRHDVQEGMRLADAMGRRKDSFPGAYRAAIAGGERSGKLGSVLKRLSDHLARERALRSKITTAMVYPAALLIIATGVICALMIFVVPTLVDQFTHLSGTLPLPTQVLIAVSDFLSRFWPVVLAGIVGVALAARLALKQVSIRLAFDHAVLDAPYSASDQDGQRQPFPPLCSADDVQRTSDSGKRSGCPRIDTQSMGLPLDRIDGGADRARRASVTCAQAQRRCSAARCLYGGRWRRVRELPLMLEMAADHLDEEFEAFIQAALSLVEPVIILIMGGIVAGIILAIMLPILQLNQLVGV